VFSHSIAGVNTLALLALLLGYRFSRRGEVRKHRAAMLTAFALIMLFLFFYRWKTGSGFEKAILASGAVTLVSLAMLGIHIRRRAGRGSERSEEPRCERGTE